MFVALKYEMLSLPARRGDSSMQARGMAPARAVPVPWLSSHSVLMTGGLGAPRK